MTGYTPEQVPVLSGIAREFGVFDHWFCEVPSQTFMNRSFWRRRHRRGWSSTARRRSGSQRTMRKRSSRGSRRTARAGRSTSGNRCGVSFAGIIHYPRLKDRLATHFVPFAEFERDAAAGTLPDFSFIEPDMAIGPLRLPPGVWSIVHRRQTSTSDCGRALPGYLAARPSWSGSSTPTAPHDLRVGHQRLEHRPSRSAGMSQAEPTTTWRPSGPAARSGCA